MRHAIVAFVVVWCGALAVVHAAEPATQGQSAALPPRDVYGGATTITAKATGFFRLEKTGGRWFFITPEGHGYIPLGINHLQTYFSGHGGKLRAGEVDLVAQQDGGQPQRAAQRVEAFLRDLEYNYAGYDAPEAFRQRMPFSVGFVQVRASATIEDVKFVDVFGPDYARDLDSRVAALCKPLRENRFLLGYYLVDQPLWGTRKYMDAEEKSRGESWLSFFRKLPADAPGRQAYEKFLAGRYAGRFDAFAKLYATGASGFDEPLGIDFDKTNRAAPEVVADDEAFVAEIADQVYRLTSDAFGRHDPNHLVLGERFEGGRLFMPVLEKAAKYFPVVAIQLEGEFKKDIYGGLFRHLGKPVISVDHIIRFETPEKLKLVGRLPPIKSQDEAAALYSRYLRDAFAEPYMVGYNRCQLVTRIRVDGDPPAYKQGIIDHQGKPYETLCQAVRAANREALARLYAAGN